MDFQRQKAIYLQIVDTMCERILSGKWRSGEKIQSLREFSAEMGVNANTVTRSFKHMEDLGVIIMQRGIGFFVTENAKNLILHSKKCDFFEKELPKLLHTMSILDISFKELESYQANSQDNVESSLL